MISFEDLRFALALASDNTIRAAARRLGVSHSTVARRLQALEQRLGVRLFDRTPDGFAATEAGAQICAAAQTMETQIAQLERTLIAQDSRPAGRIRFTAPASFLRAPFTDAIADFLALNPDIELETVPSFDLADLARREADIAIRFLGPRSKPEDHLIGRPLAQSCHAFYVSVHGLRDGVERRCIGFDAPKSDKTQPDFPDFPVAPARHVIPDAHLQAEFCAQGLGYAELPCSIGDLDPRLRRAPRTTHWCKRRIWVVMHPDIRHVARFRAFKQCIEGAVIARRGLYEGETAVKGA